MKTLLSAAAALAIIVGSSAALADSGDGPQFNLPQPVPATGPATTTIVASTLNSNVANEAEPVFAGQPAVIAQNGGGGFLAANGNEAGLQTANSAPAGFGIDTVALAARATGLHHYALR
jgi:hypothetical protein